MLANKLWITRGKSQLIFKGFKTVFALRETSLGRFKSQLMSFVFGLTPLTVLKGLSRDKWTL